MVIAGIVLLSITAKAQTINWDGLKDYRHIINANVGLEYGTVFGMGYGYHIKTKLFPIVVGADYSFPSGGWLFDDFKIRAGAQVSWIDFHHFRFNTRVNGVFRRYQNDFVRLENFGCDLAATIGYYRQMWFTAAEVGFDKAIVSNFKHSQAYMDQFPGVTNGWFIPPQGGNFYFGLQAGFTYRRHDIYIRAGKVLTQDFKTSPRVPFYAQLGYNIKF